MPIGLHLDQKALGFHRRHHGFAGLKAIQALETASRFVHGAVLSHHRDQRQLVALANGEIVGVMGGGHLHAARAELGIHVGIGHDRNLPAHQRQRQALTHQLGIAGIGRVHGHARIPQQGFRAGGGHLEVGAAIRAGGAEGIAEMPKVAVHLLHLHLQVAHRRARSGTPIDQVFPPVNQALLVQAHKGLNHGLTTAGIQGEPLPLPIHRIAQPAQLAHDRAAALHLPLPSLLQKGSPPQVILGFALGLELLLKDRLHGNRRMVGAWQAQHVLAAQALEAHDRVDQGRVEGMAHVQAAGHVGRWDHHREGFPLRRRIGMEGSALLPGLLPAALGAGGVVGLGQVGHGESSGLGTHALKRLRQFKLNSRINLTHKPRSPWCILVWERVLETLQCQVKNV